MRYLTQGGQSAERLELLLQLTSISSEPVKDALADHLVRGLADATSDSLNGITQANFNRALKTLEAVATKVERIKEIDWRHLRT